MEANGRWQQQRKRMRQGGRLERDKGEPQSVDNRRKMSRCEPDEAR